MDPDHRPTPRQTEGPPTMVRLAAVLASVALVIAACSDGGSDEVASTTTDATTTTTTDASTTTTTLPEAERCDHPDGYSVVPPAGWTGRGAGESGCAQWHPEPFAVPEATDERVAPITAYVDPVPYSTAAARVGGEEDRAVTAIDGRQAVRRAYAFGDDGLHPAGTRITSYLVDLTGEDGDPATLFLDTIDLEPFDYEANVAHLDEMARTLEVTGPNVDTDPSLIATYLGGGGGFTVSADARGDEVCLRIPPNGEEVCTEEPTSDQLSTVALRDLQDQILAGVVGRDVWRIDVIGRDGATVPSSLASPIPGTELGGFAIPNGLAEVERIELLDISGDELRSITPGG